MVEMHIARALCALKDVVPPESMRLAMEIGIRSAIYLILSDFYAGHFFLKRLLHFEGVQIALFDEIDDALYNAVFGYDEIAAGIVAMGRPSCSDRERF